MTGFNIYRLLVNYIKHYQQIRRGDYSQVHATMKTPVNLMTGNLKFQAYQTAYIILGFSIQAMFLWLVFVVITWGIILPMTLPIPIVRTALMDILKNKIAPTLAYVVFITVFQRVLCQYVLLQDPNKNAAIDNRRLYHLCAYFFYMTVSVWVTHSSL